MKIYFRRTASALTSAVVFVSSVSFTAFAQENERQDVFGIMDVVSDSPSEYGYKPIYIADSDGNAVDTEKYEANTIHLPALKAYMSSLRKATI